MLYIQFVAVAFQLWKSPLEKAPHWRIMALPWIHPWADWPKSLYKCAGGHEYFIPTKFGK